MYDKKHKIFIVESRGDIAELIKLSLEQEKYIIKTSDNIKTAIDEMQSFKPHLLILDLDLSDISGWELLRYVKGNNQTRYLPVLVISGKYTQPVHIVRALNDFCADDYVIKPVDRDVLVARIKALLRRAIADRFVSDPKCEIIKFGNLKIDIPKMVVSINSTPIKLTNTAFKLLTTFICHKDKPLSREYLLETVLGYSSSYNVDIRTIDKHIELLRKKLKKYSRRIVTISGVGYKFVSRK